jgi:hypothetical protein
MTDPLIIPDEKRAYGGTSVRNTALNSIALSFFAGVWAGLGFHWLTKSPPNLVGLFDLFVALAFLIVAIRRVMKLFPRNGTQRTSTIA